MNACTLLRSCGSWHSVISVVALMKAKFQPTPSSASPTQKFHSAMPTRLMAAATRINVSPIAIIARTPKRAISEPVMKLGAYMPMTCH